MADKRSDQTPESAGATSGPRRIDGLDAARALAVFGMFAVHLGVDSIGLFPDDQAETVHSIVRGNSSALFAFLAGVSLAMMTGRTAPISGDPLRRAVVRILARALMIGLLGFVLDALGAPIAVILTYYAGFFVLALPLVRVRAGTLWAVAGGLAVIGPAVSFLLREHLVDPPAGEASLNSVGEFFLTGYYPAITFMVFVFAGMAVGRTDLASTAVRLRLLLTGAVLTVIGYLGSWVLLYPLGGLDRLVEVRSTYLAGRTLDSVGDPVLAQSLRENVIEEMHSMRGQVPTDSWWWLAVNAPHTGTPLENAESVGLALVVLVVLMWLAERARLLLYPLTSVGRMPLTVYAGHIVIIALLGFTASEGEPWRLEWFILGSLVFASLWRPTVGQGPAELAVGRVADGAVVAMEERRAERGADQRRSRGPEDL